MRGQRPNYLSIALYRLSALAFVLCIASAIALGLMGLALSQKPPTLIAIDDQGRVHGYIEYLRPDSRSDEEIRLAIVQFAKSYLSVSSANIVADTQLALTMMAPEMAEHEKRLLIESNRIATIEQSGISGRVQLERIDIERRSSGLVAVAVDGQIQIGQGRRPFGVLIEARIVPRTIHRTLGLRIESISDR